MTAPAEYWTANAAGHYLADAMMQAICHHANPDLHDCAIRSAHRELAKAATALGMAVTPIPDGEPVVTLAQACDRWTAFHTALDGFMQPRFIHERFWNLFPRDAALVAERAPELGLTAPAPALAAE